MEAHQKTVSIIAAQISSFYRQQVPFRIYHGSTNSTQSRKVDPARMVDTSNLDHVLKINKNSKTCLVEPNVPMDQLVDATLPLGLVPPVVMEFPGITVGGAFAGTAGESSGFKYGFFDNTVNWIECVLATGEIVTASSQERDDLFFGAAGSFGTLGVTTLLEVQLIDAKRYVEITYHPTSTISHSLTTLRAECDVKDNDFVDGILFGKNHGVIVSGRLTDELAAGLKVQHFSRAHDPWFYIHAKRLSKGKSVPVKEAIPLRDYLFRYDRGAFWTGSYAFKYFITPFNPVTRYILDYFMHTRVMYHALHASGHASKYLIQDLLLPSETVHQFIEYIDKEFRIWPLWLCPFRKEREIPLHPRLPIRGDETEPRWFVNVGVWGPGSTNYAQFVGQNRQLEQKVRELGGIKWLYAHVYYTEDEMWSIYDKAWYDELREKYQAAYLPTVYEKVKADVSKLNMYPDSWSDWLRQIVWNTWPVSGLYGVWKALSEREYLLAK
ncbi:hypothetical protein M433DRAFT_27941 [Acidomyces richmondensis BFW]|nr:MAG: hypothetical protein FE78DRAFT_38598 [Acidomyces sp. 'richmondensis']KYG40896.1 hypothetical protein M433DRAFT_27941 [Acidomyces richmondensis BFW]